MKPRELIVLLLVTTFNTKGLQGAASADKPALVSPDGRIKVSIQMPKPDSSELPRWSADFKGEPLLQNCQLGLQTTDSGELLSGSRMVSQQSRSNKSRIPVLFGKADHADDNFNETRLVLEGAARHQVAVVFRCYDDAVAIRYELPAGGNKTSLIITNESTSFQVEGNPTAFVQYLENFTTSHEHNVTTVPYKEIKTGALLDLPLTLAWNDRTFVAITEGALRHYAGMSLMRESSQSHGSLVCQLTPQSDGTRVQGTLPLKTPWRVVLMSDRAGALLESETVYCLNEPPAIGDLSWIKPGKLTFHWWNGDTYDGRPGPLMLSFEMAQKYIDFAASNGIPLVSFTSTEGLTTPWYQQSKEGVAPGPDTDVTRPRPGFDLERIKGYADSKHVRLWTWVHQAALRGRVEEAFTAFEKLGWSGMMVDFFDHDDQESIELAEAILQAAARHHILIHFHGVWKPTGWQRTYPNLMNHEGALNLEYLKWSDRCPPEHDLMMAFTRLIAGPMDYHLGGFRAVPREKFVPRNIAPTVLGTRCHMLAMYVCFDNPSPMVADYPTAYEGQAGFEFLTKVPTWWDETRVVEARIGELLVTARRKGDVWYLGGMCAKGQQSVDLPLSFLGFGRYTVRLWKDAADAKSDPNHLERETVKMRVGDHLKLGMAEGGGFVAEVVRADD